MFKYLYKEGVKSCTQGALKVAKNGSPYGEIRSVDGGFQFFPLKGNAGAVLSSVDAVQKSLQEKG